MKTDKKKIIITKEHGSWAVLFIPILTGITSTWSISVSLILFIISTFFLFMSYTPAEIVLMNYLRKMPSGKKIVNARYWMTLFLTLSIAAGLPLILLMHKYLLIYFALAALFFFFISLLIVIKYRKNVWSDLMAMVGLTISAPAAIYLAENAVSQKSVIVWILNVLFFGSSAFYVHMKMKLTSLKKTEIPLDEKIRIGRLNIIYHIIAVLLLTAFTAVYPSKWVIILAFVPIIVHALAGTFRMPEKISFKKIGITFLVYSIFFLLCMSVSGL